MAEYTEICKVFKRMCNSFDECSKCPMNKARDSAYTCRYWMLCVDPEAAEKVVMKWNEENPPVTNRDKFKEVFGFDPLTDKHLMCGTPIVGWFGKEYEEPEDERSNQN